MTTRRERERGRFDREARQTFGIRAQAAELSQLVEVPPSVALDIERRMYAKHDATKASGCRVCGVTLRGVEGSAERPWSEIDGWKCCGPCQALLPGGLAALLSDLLGQPVQAAETVEVLDRMGSRSPAFFWDRWPSDPGHERRFAHLAPDFAERGRVALADVRGDRQLRRSSSGRGCMACGRARSTRWVEVPWRWGSGRDAPRGSVCGDCLGWVQRSGALSGHGGWRPYLLAAITGMRRPSMYFDLGVKAYFESAPDDPSGTEQAWAYLGEVRAKLRARVVREHPRLVVLSEHERRVQALQEASAAVERPPTPRLAEVD